MSETAATATTGKKRERRPVEVPADPAAAEPAVTTVGMPQANGDSAAPRSKGRAASQPVEPIEIPEDLAGGVEALLFSVDKALGWARIAAAVGLIDQDAAAEAAAKDDEGGGDAAVVGKGKGARRAAGPAAIIREAVARLNTAYEQSGRAFRIEQVANGYRVMTLARHAEVLERFHGGRERSALSKAAIETLAIIAYKQPLTRAGLEAIRGVACGEILRALLERRLITIVGRAEELGRPILYGTSKRFLETFGLGSLKDLPTVEELRMRARGEGTPEPARPVEPDSAEAE